MTNQANAVVEIRKKKTTDWGALLSKAADDHWRKLKITIRFRDKLHAGKPKQLDAAKAMLAARGLGEVVEAIEAERTVDERAEEVVDQGLCEFARRVTDNKPGLWFPSNNIKAMLKENWSVLGYRKDARPKASKKSDGKEGKALQGSRGAMAEGLFVVSTDPDDRDWIYLGAQPDGIDTAVAHTTGPKGPQASIKRNEYLLKTTVTFEVHIAKAVADKMPDESFADMLVHAAEHGLGANRSQGFGRFDIVSVEELP